MISLKGCFLFHYQAVEKVYRKAQDEELRKCGSLTYKAYIYNTKAQTGKTPDDFMAAAKKRGFIRNGETVANHGEKVKWLKSEFKLGHGHANAIVLYLKYPEVAKKKMQEDAKKIRKK
jgi:Domain of unknown function (DUF4287)